MSLTINGIGTAVPALRVTQTEAVEAARQFCPPNEDHARLLTALYRRSGVDTRHSVLLDSPDGPVMERQTLYQPSTGAADRGPTTSTRMQRFEAQAPALAVHAARAALDDARRSARDISHLITVSCSGFSAPGFDFALFEELGLSRTVPRTHVGFMGCHAALNALRVAHSFTTSDPQACVLVCAVELCTLHHRYGWDPERIVSNALFADGAAALIGTCPSTQAGGEWRLQANGSILLENSADAMTWRVGDHGFEMTLAANVPELIQRHLSPWLETWLADHKLSVSQIASWAVHPGGPRILSATAEAIRLSRESLAVSAKCLAEYGNMSSPTLLFILQRLRAANSPRPCVALGFGPGLAIEAALFQ